MISLHIPPSLVALVTAKAQKPMYSILIYDEIRSMDPPGRFLKQDPATKLWSDIGKKKALDKTRQALREGAPEMLKELGGEEDEGEDEMHQKQSKRRREDNPLNSSFMSNVSIGSFTVDGLNNPSPDLFSPLANQGQGVGNNPGAMGMNLQNLQGADMNQLLMTAQMQLLQQQMQQWQQVVNPQNNLNALGNQLDPNTQLQLLTLQLQLQNQMGQQQNTPAIPNFIGPQTQAPALNMPPPAPQPAAANAPQIQLNEQNLAALLTALQNAAPQNAMPNGLPPPGTPNLNNFQNQMAMMQLNNQINEANANQAPASANPSGGNAGNIDNILSAADAINDGNGTNQDMTDSAMPLQNNERKPGGTSLARSQRIGLKNSFTRRPNSHRQATNPLAHSLMSVESLNLDDEGENADDTSNGMQEDA